MTYLEHPCKDTCSGWKQGYERGVAEMQSKLEQAEAPAKLCGHDDPSWCDYTCFRETIKALKLRIKELQQAVPDTSALDQQMFLAEHDENVRLHTQVEELADLLDANLLRKMRTYLGIYPDDKELAGMIRRVESALTEKASHD